MRTGYPYVRKPQQTSIDVMGIDTDTTTLVWVAYGGLLGPQVVAPRPIALGQSWKLRCFMGSPEALDL